MGVGVRRGTHVVAVTALLAALVLTGCSSSKKDTSSGSSGVTLPGGKTVTPVSVEDGETSPTVFFMKANPTSVPAGPTTFTLTNSGSKEHEMIVLKTDTPADQLKVGSDHKVSESDSVGEVSETKAGKTGSVTLDLKPGNYVLVCNIEKHYEQHMFSAFTVT